MPAAVEKIKLEGNEMFKKGRYGEAKDLYTKAIEKLLPRKSTVLLNLVFLALIFHTECCQIFKLAYTCNIVCYIVEKPMQDHNLCLLYSNRGNCYTKMGDMENCAKDCNSALEINPAAIKPLVRRAAAYEAMEKYEF